MVYWHPNKIIYPGRIILFASKEQTINKLPAFPDNNFIEKKLHKTLRAGENHVYNSQSNVGEMLHIKVEQHGFDVMAKVTAERGSFTEQLRR